jgi:Ala-tRNA(Pro) deacylase
MAIAPTFEKYLAAKHVAYDVVAHQPTKSSMRSAEACRVSGDRVAKAVVLRDEYGYVLAILPASHHIRLQDLRMQLGLDVNLATEHEIEELFQDCVPGSRDAGAYDPRAIRIAYRDGAARQLQRPRLRRA